MAKEAHEIEAFLRGIEGQQDLAQQAGDLASKLEATQILRITPKVELPEGVRTERLTTGTMTKVDFARAFEQRHIQVSSYAQDLRDKINLTTEAKQVNLIWQSGRDLGLTRGAPYREFLAAGQTKGYELCDPEVALYLRLQVEEQLLNDVYWMAMEPIADRNDLPSVFALAHSQDGLWLRAYWMLPSDVWSPEDRLVFSLTASETQKT